MTRATAHIADTDGEAGGTLRLTDAPHGRDRRGGAETAERTAVGDGQGLGDGEATEPRLKEPGGNAGSFGGSFGTETRTRPPDTAGGPARRQPLSNVPGPVPFPEKTPELTRDPDGPSAGWLSCRVGGEAAPGAHG